MDPKTKQLFAKITNWAKLTDTELIQFRIARENYRERYEYMMELADKREEIIKKTQDFRSLEKVRNRMLSSSICTSSF
jgi:hypothetical protein